MQDYNKNSTSVYRPSAEDTKAINCVLTDFITARSVLNKNYAQFNNRNLYDSIDNWTMRWNGYLSYGEMGSVPNETQLFLNFTRNQIIGFLSKVAMQRPDVKIQAVNKKTGVADKRFAEFLKDINKYSLDEENGDARFLEAAFEVLTKGTVVVYEGYRKDVQKSKVPQKFDAETGKIKYKEEERVIFDNCFQKVVPLEDFYITNPYQADVQKQPKIMWRELTTYEECKGDFGHYPNYKYIVPGTYVLTGEPTTFYRNSMTTDLQNDQVEIIRYYCRAENQHIVLINGIVMYDGPIPFKDGMYPFAKTVFEPFDNNFFWGAGFPNKVMGEQDLMNTFWGMMVDKTKGSLLPYGLSSDLDDIIEDDVLRPNKIRKVSDINKWKFDTLPGISSGEQAMLQQTMNFAREFSGDIAGGADAMTSKGGKVTARQALLQQKESQQRLSYSLYFLEDLERDRTKLRINHLLQFLSLPKMEKISGKSGKEIQDLVYRDIKLNNVSLSDGQNGDKYIKLVNNDTTNNPDERQKMADDLSVMESMGEEMGTPTEALAVSVDTFYDYNFAIQVVRNSSYERNQILDQASRMEYANWLLSMTQFGVPVDAPEVVKWVSESYDIEDDRFIPEQQQGMIPGMPGQPPQPGLQPAQQMAPGQMKPQTMPPLSEMVL